MATQRVTPGRPSVRPTGAKSRALRAYHHGDLPRALIDAALAIIATDGIAAMTLRGVARRAGVSHAAPLHHFRDLDGLHRAIAAEGFDLLARAQRAAADGAPDQTGLTRFRAVGIAYVEFAAQHPAYFRAMFHPRVADRSVDPALAANGGAAFELLLESVKGAQAEGSVADADPRELALSAWSMVHGLAALLSDGQLADRGFSTNDVTVLVTEASRRLFLGLRPFT